MLAGAASAPAATTVNMVLWPGPEGDAMQKVVDAWNKEQGAEQGVHVKVILLSRDNTFSRETTEIGAKSSNIDIYFVASYNVNFYQPGLEPIDTIASMNRTPSNRRSMASRSTASSQGSDRAAPLG
jgi:multiple sugar transport system substrate-binding protein